MAGRYSEAQQPGTAVSVPASTSTLLIGGNDGRSELVVVNDSDQIVYLRLAATGAVVNSGVRLNAAGGSWSTGSYNGPVCAFHAGVGAKVVLVTEV